MEGPGRTDQGADELAEAGSGGPRELRALQRALLRRSRDLQLLRQENASLRRRVEALEAAGTTLVSAANLTELPRLLTNVITASVGADAGSLMLRDPATGKLHFEVATGEKGEEVKRFELGPGEGIAGWVAETGQPAIVADAAQDPRHRHDIPAEIGYETRTMLAVPMTAGGELIGVIEVLNRKDGRPFDEADLRLLEPLASLAAVAIQRAHAYLDSERRIRELGLFIGVGQAVSGATELDELLDTTMTMAAEVLNAEASACMQLDDSGEYLAFTVATGEKGEAVKELRIPVGEGVAGWVAQHGQPLLVADTSKDPRFTGSVDEQTHFKTRSILAAPMKIKDQLLGVLEVLNPRGGGQFDEHHLELLCTLASWAAIAVQNAKLLASTRELFVSTVDALAAALDASHPYTQGHSRRVARLCAVVAERMGLPAAIRESLHLTAVLHDFGKIGIPASILDKPGPLTAAEWEIMRQHPILGAEIVKNISHPTMKRVSQALRHHHEWWDGSGYPDGLAGEQIPVEARIVATVDAFCVMIGGRPYQPPRTPEAAEEELQRCAGTQFDPEAVAVFVAVRQELGDRL